MAMLRTLWDRLPFVGRLLATASLALIIAGAAMLLVSARQEAAEVRADLKVELAKDLESLPASLAESVVIGDFATLQQTLDRYVTHPLVAAVEFRDATGVRLHSEDIPLVPKAPGWFISMFRFSDVSGTSGLTIGGRTYGDVSITLTPRSLADRAWTHLKNHLTILLLAIALDFFGIWLVLRSGLAPLKQLESGADAMAAGDLGVRLVPDGSPELRHVIESFDRMAVSIQAAQAKLKQSECESIQQSKRLAEVIWGTDIGTWEWNIQTGETVFNDRWAEIIGYTLAELAPVSIATWNSFVHPDDGRHSGELLANCFNRETATYECEVRMRHKNGSWVWILDRGRVVEWTADGKPLRMSGTHQDITKQKQLEEKLKEERDFSNGVLDTAISLVMVINREGIVVRLNREAQEFTGYSFDEVKDQPFFWERFLLPEQRPQVREVFSKLVTGTVVRRYENYWVRKDGSKRLFDWSNSLLRDAGGNVEYLVTVGIDITERKIMEEQLHKAMRYNRSLIEAGLDPLVTISKDGKIMDVNHATVEVTGVAREQLIGSDFSDYFTDPEKARESYRQVFLHGFVSDFPLSIRNLNGHTTDVLYSASVFRDEDGEVAGVFAAARDITKLKQTAAHIEHLAHFDTLTDLPNRTLFHDRLQQALVAARRDRTHLALLYLDLDRFKQINDTFGHHIGDLLLSEAARRMQESVRESDTVARIGGDEFVVLLPNVDTAEDALLVAEKIQNALREIFILDDVRLEISSSIGVAIYPEHGGNEATLARNADTAMYCVKASGRNAVMLYQAGMPGV